MSDEQEMTADGVQENSEAPEGSEHGDASEQQTASGVGETVRNAVASAGHAVGERYQRVADAARDSYRKGRETIHDWDSDLGEHLRHRPVSSLLIAAGIGLIAGFLIGASRDK